MIPRFGEPFPRSAAPNLLDPACASCENSTMPALRQRGDSVASLFPGMDPYLEDPAFWPDFHHRFINYWCEAVADELPEAYEARLDERVNLAQMRETRIDILHRPDRSLVAVLEMLSPANKTGDGFQEYRAKRKAILQQKVHLLELDLLVGVNRLPHLRPLPAGDYFALVSRADNRPNCEVFSWPVRDPQPRIP